MHRILILAAAGHAEYTIDCNRQQMQMSHSESQGYSAYGESQFLYFLQRNLKCTFNQHHVNRCGTAPARAHESRNVHGPARARMTRKEDDSSDT